MKKLLVPILALLLVFGPVAAQDETPEPTAEGTSVVTEDNEGNVTVEVPADSEESTTIEVPVIVTPSDSDLFTKVAAVAVSIFVLLQLVTTFMPGILPKSAVPYILKAGAIVVRATSSPDDDAALIKYAESRGYVVTQTPTQITFTPKE